MVGLGSGEWGAAASAHKIASCEKQEVKEEGGKQTTRTPPPSYLALGCHCIN